MFERHVFLALAPLMLTACMAGPDYIRPAFLSSDIPAQAWHAPLPHDGKVADLSRWWEQFHDPVLTGLITDAEATSPTLQQAVARLRQARADVTEDRAGLFPSVTAEASSTRGNNNTGFAKPITISAADFDASWEIDLFGGQRRTIESAQASLQASQAGWHDARITLASDVANAYIDRRDCESAIEIYRQELKSEQETGVLTDMKVRAGFAATSDADLSAATAAATQNNLDAEKSTCAQNLNRLVYLTGVAADALEQRLAASPGIVPEPDSVAVTALPAQAVRQRPDVAQKERTLAAVSADIGVAAADRLPSLSLSGLIGVNRQSGMSNIQTWSFGPSVSLPVFDAGKRRAAVDKARAVYDEDLGAYRDAVRTAVKEVEDALSRLATIDSRRAASEEAVRRYDSYFRSAQSGNQAGITSLLDLEEARRRVFDAQQTLTAVRQEQAEAWIALYKAAGGGWDMQYELPQEKKS